MVANGLGLLHALGVQRSMQTRASTYSQYATSVPHSCNWPPPPLGIFPFSGGFGPQCDTCSLGPYSSIPETAAQSVQPFLHCLPVLPACRQTDTQTIVLHSAHWRSETIWNITILIAAG